MHKVKKILVPIDFSPESGLAMRDADSLARETGAQLIALHVIDDKAEREMMLSFVAPVEGLPFLLDSAATIPLDVMMRERTLSLWNFVEHEAGPRNRARIRQVVRIGDPTREITAFMRSEKVDLLFLKLRPSRLFPDFKAFKLLKIARQLSCPVLLDPPSDRGPSGPRNGIRVFDFLSGWKRVRQRPVHIAYDQAKARAPFSGVSFR